MVYKRDQRRESGQHRIMTELSVCWCALWLAVGEWQHVCVGCVVWGWLGEACENELMIEACIWCFHEKNFRKLRLLIHIVWNGGETRDVGVVSFFRAENHEQDCANNAFLLITYENKNYLMLMFYSMMCCKSTSGAAIKQYMSFGTCSTNYFTTVSRRSVCGFVFRPKLHLIYADLNIGLCLQACQIWKELFPWSTCLYIKAEFKMILNKGSYLAHRYHRKKCDDKTEGDRQT